MRHAPISELTENDVLDCAIPEPNSGCWLWLRGISSKGYGHWYLSKKSTLLAHRVSYMIKHGPVPSSTFICHRCDNPLCVNPDHLFPGTGKDNMADMASKGRNFVPGLSGEQHPNARITESMVRQIRASKDVGRVIAARFGVSLSTVYHVRNRRYWGHVQ